MVEIDAAHVNAMKHGEARKPCRGPSSQNVAERENMCIRYFATTKRETMCIRYVATTERV